MIFFTKYMSLQNKYLDKISILVALRNGYVMIFTHLPPVA